MVIRLHNLTKWKQFEPGEVLEFLGEHDRKVRVELNTETKTHLTLVHGDDDDPIVTFLAVIEGNEVLEFTAPGGSALTATSEGEVWYFTNEGDHIATDRQAESFTKVMNRRARNPQLEQMMWKMEQNMNMRLSLMADEIEARHAAEGVAHDTATGEVEDDEDGGADTDGIQAEQPEGDGGAESDEPKPEDEGKSARTRAKS